MLCLVGLDEHAASTARSGTASWPARSNRTRPPAERPRPAPASPTAAQRNGAGGAPSRARPAIRGGGQKTEGMPANQPQGDDLGRRSRTEFPPGIIGMTEKPEGVLLRYNTEQPGVGAARGPDPAEVVGSDARSGPVPEHARARSTPRSISSVRPRYCLAQPPPNEVARFQLGQGRLVLTAASSGTAVRGPVRRQEHPDHSPRREHGRSRADQPVRARRPRFGGFGAQDLRLGRKPGPRGG